MHSCIPSYRWTGYLRVKARPWARQVGLVGHVLLDCGHVGRRLAHLHLVHRLPDLHLLPVRLLLLLLVALGRPLILSLGVVGALLDAVLAIPSEITMCIAFLHHIN